MTGRDWWDGFKLMKLILIIWLVVGVPFSIWMFHDVHRGKSERSDLPAYLLYGLSGLALWPLYFVALGLLHAWNYYETNKKRKRRPA